MKLFLLKIWCWIRGGYVLYEPHEYIGDIISLYNYKQDLQKINPKVEHCKGCNGTGIVNYKRRILKNIRYGKEVMEKGFYLDQIDCPKCGGYNINGGGYPPNCCFFPEKYP